MKIRKDSRKEDLHINIDTYEEEMMSYANEIIAYLMKSGVSPDQAQDVTQDVFVQILEANYSLPSSKLRAWMYRTAIRRYIDLYRRDKHYYDILKRDFFSQESLNAYDQEGYDMLDEANYSLTGAFNAGASDVFSKNKLLYDRGNLQKIPQFYNTKVKFSKNDVKTSPSQDLKYLNQLNDKVIEVAITFDKPYTYKEIKTMLPKNLKQNWLWIGTYTTLDTSQWPNQFGTDTENIHSAINTMFNVSKNSPHVGINNVNIYSDLDNYLKDNKHIKDVDQLSFAGIILTGKSENFNSLKGKKWIYGSSLGASIDYQPYYQLDVE